MSFIRGISVSRVTGCRLWTSLCVCANSWLHVVNSATFVHAVTLLPQLQILEQYWVDWKRDAAATVHFQFERGWFSNGSVCGKLSNVEGREWKATLIDSEVS